MQPNSPPYCLYREELFKPSRKVTGSFQAERERFCKRTETYIGKALKIIVPVYPYKVRPLLSFKQFIYNMCMKINVNRLYDKNWR